MEDYIDQEDPQTPPLPKGYNPIQKTPPLPKGYSPLKKKEPFETDPNFLLRNVLNGSSQKLGPSGNISFPTISPSQEETNNLPSTSTLDFQYTDARVGGEDNTSKERIASPKTLAKALAIGAASGVSGTLKSIGIAAKRLDFFNEYTGKKAEELATYKAGKWIDEQVKDLVGDLTPEEQKNFSVHLASGMGQIGTFMLGGAGSKALGMSEGLTGAFLGAATQSSAEYENAINAGATPDQASKAYWLNAGIGTIYAFPIMGAFRKLDKYTGGLATGVLAKQIASTAEGRLTSDMLHGAITNAATLAGQNILTNVVAKNTYDATRKVFDGLGESLATGSIIGATMHGITSGIREKRAAGNLTPEENADLDKAEAFANEKINEVEKADKQAQNIVNHATKVKENLVDKGIPEDVHDDYVANSLVEKLANEKAEKLTDPTLIKEQKDIASEAAEIKGQILKGVKPEDVVTEKQQKEIEEKEKNAREFDKITQEKDLFNQKIQLKLDEIAPERTNEANIKRKEIKLERDSKNKEYDIKLKKLTPKEEVVETEKDANAEEVTPSEKVTPSPKQTPTVSEPLKDVESRIEKAYEIEDEVERKKELDAIYGSDEYKQWIDNAEHELKNNPTQVAEGGGTWRKEFNETGDAMRKKDILRAVADVSTDKTELNDILEAAKGLPEGLQPEVNYAVEHKLKSIPQSSNPPSKTVSEVGDGGNLKFTTHTGEEISGKRLTDAINKVSENAIENAKRKRDEHYASHVTEKQKDDILSKDLAYAEEIKEGKHLDNFTIWQRINRELTGESIPLFSKEAAAKRFADEVVLDESPSKLDEPKSARKVGVAKETKELLNEVDSQQTENQVETEVGKPPTEGELVVEGEGGGSKKGITHEATQESTRKAGLPDYEGQPVETHAERIAKAKADIAANPNLANETMEKAEKNAGSITPQDNAVLAVYKGALDKELEANPSKEIFDRINRLAKVLNPEGSYAGKLLESRKLIDFNEDNLANFLLEKQAAQGTALTEPQIKSESAKYEELKAAKEKLEEQLQKEREQHAKDIAELGLNKARAKAKKAAKKSHEEYAAERKASVDAAKEALKKIRQDQSLKATVPGLAELKAIAPHVKDFLQSLANEGVDKLDVAISKIHAEFKDVLEGISTTDIFNIIGGEYDTKKEQTRNQKAANLRLIQREAALLKELAAARKGEEKAKGEKQKTASNRRIDELKQKIKDVRQQRKEEGEPVEDASVGEAERLDSEIDKLTKKAQSLANDIKNKKYLEEKPKPKPFARSAKYKALQDRVIDLENKIRHERSKDEYEKRSKVRKVFDKVMEVLGIRRLVQSAVDISVPFRQGATLISPRRIDVWAKGFKANLQSVFSPKKFNRIMYEIRHDQDYHDMVKDRIVFNDLGAADPNLHNEDFRKSFIYDIPVISEPLKASNRSADAFLNVARYEMYKKMKRVLEMKGLTRESDPEAYKFMGNWIMSMTGRGRMTNMLENSVAHTVLGNTFYGARLMASRFNLLNPVTYFDPRVPREAKVEAMKDMAAFVVTTMAAGAGLAAAGGKVSLNPDDSDFLQVRFGEKVYDISGGLANYVRTFLRIVKAGYTKATETKFEGKQATDKAGESVLNFFRNKLSPNTGYAADAFFGGRYGQGFDPTDIAKIYPMYADDAIKAFKDEGAVSLATVLLPNILGIGYGSYASKGQIDKNLEDLKKRNMRSDEMNNEKIYNYNDGGRQITDKEFDKFADLRDEKVEKGIEKLFKEGALVLDENNEPVQKPYNELTPEQVAKETSEIKAKATTKAKEELFGKKKETIKEKEGEAKLEGAKKLKEFHERNQ